MQEIKRNQMFDDISLLNNINQNDEFCEACVNGKQSRLK